MNEPIDKEVAHFIKLNEIGIEDIDILNFENVLIGDKFATIANAKIVVWTKIRDGLKFFEGESDDGYTCPVENAITDGGFSACFRAGNLVFPVDTKRFA
jgi:hypothetical protein